MKCPFVDEAPPYAPHRVSYTVSVHHTMGSECPNGLSCTMTWPEACPGAG